MLPTLVTLVRVVLVFVAVGLFGHGVAGALAAVLLTALVLWMDALDGWVARRTGQDTEMGALLDITGDRIVENVFWIYFATAGLVTFWVPVLVITRGFLTDTVRALQFERGRTPFGAKTMMRARWSRFLVAGRWMRGLYGAAKALAFVSLGTWIALERGLASGRIAVPEAVFRGTTQAAQILVAATVSLCILRGIPVLWDGRDLLVGLRLPRPRD
jgi:CDP-diacylglycerol--glycerol-3-phosphate 3-phosphatidyltransferase